MIITAKDFDAASHGLKYSFVDNLQAKPANAFLVNSRNNIPLYPDYLRGCAAGDRQFYVVVRNGEKPILLIDKDHLQSCFWIKSENLSDASLAVSFKIDVMQCAEPAHYHNSEGQLCIASKGAYLIYNPVMGISRFDDIAVLKSLAHACDEKGEDIDHPHAFDLKTKCLVFTSHDIKSALTIRSKAPFLVRVALPQEREIYPKLCAIRDGVDESNFPVPEKLYALTNIKTGEVDYCTPAELSRDFFPVGKTADGRDRAYRKGKLLFIPKDTHIYFTPTNTLPPQAEANYVVAMSRGTLPLRRKTFGQTYIVCDNNGRAYSHRLSELPDIKTLFPEKTVNLPMTDGDIRLAAARLFQEMQHHQ